MSDAQASQPLCIRFSTCASDAQQPNTAAFLHALLVVGFESSLFLSSHQVGAGLLFSLSCSILSWTETHEILDGVCHVCCCLLPGGSLGQLFFLEVSLWHLVPESCQPLQLLFWMPCWGGVSKLFFLGSHQVGVEP